MDWTLSEPMLAAAVDTPALPRNSAAEPKWDGWRALLALHADGRVIIRSRKGTDMTAAFPEIVSAAATLPADTGLDGELIVLETTTYPDGTTGGRVAFERLQGRLNRKPAATARLAQTWPARFVAFDLLHRGTDFTSRPYAERRAALEQLFAERRLSPPFELCPSTTDPATAQGWLEWTAVGVEGLVFKRLDQRYLPGSRGWRKYRTRHTTEALVGAVSSSIARPQTVLLGRFDATGRLQFVGRTAVLPSATGRSLATRLTGAEAGHPWTGWRFSAGWGTDESLQVTLVEPLLVAEVAVDNSLDSAGRWRHPVRWVRVRDDLTVADVPLSGGGDGFLHD